MRVSLKSFRPGEFFLVAHNGNSPSTRMTCTADHCSSLPRYLTAYVLCFPSAIARSVVAPLVMISESNGSISS